MEPHDRDEIIRKRREGHGAIMLVALLMTLLLAGTALVAFKNAAVFKAAPAPESSLEPRAASPAVSL